MIHARHRTQQSSCTHAPYEALVGSCPTRLDDRCGGVGGSGVLRAIRAVSSASQARGLAL